MRHYNAQEYGRALSTALEALGTAAAERDRAIEILAKPPDGTAMVSAYEIAASADGKVDDGMAAMAEGLPPEDYVPLHGSLLLALQALFQQWPAELAAYGHGALGNAHDAALKSGEAKRATAEFYHWWGNVQVLLRLMERDVPDLARALGLTPAARRVIDKDDWVRTARG